MRPEPLIGCIREHGPMTISGMCAVLGLDPATARESIYIQLRGLCRRGELVKVGYVTPGGGNEAVYDLPERAEIVEYGVLFARISKEDMDRLSAISADQGISRSELVRRIIGRYLEEVDG